MKPRGILPANALNSRTAAILRVFLDEPGSPRDAWDVCVVTGLPTDTVHRFLSQMIRAEWVTPVYVEDPQDGRPPRTCYVMPSSGNATVLSQLASLKAEYKLIDDSRQKDTAWELIAARLGYRNSSAASRRYKVLAEILAKAEGPQAVPGSSPLPPARADRDLEITRRLLAGESAAALAAEFRMTHQNVYHIVGKCQDRVSGSASGDPHLSRTAQPPP
jgi:hypothetical protein